MYSRDLSDEIAKKREEEEKKSFLYSHKLSKGYELMMGKSARKAWKYRDTQAGPVRVIKSGGKKGPVE